MATRKEEEIMAEYLLKGGKMLEKTCKTCGCPLFEVKGKTLCVVCAENAIAQKGIPAGTTAAAVPDAAHPQVSQHPHAHAHGETCSCGEEHGGESCDDGGLTEEVAFTIHSLCLRIQDEKDPEAVLTLMNSVKVGVEALDILCKL